VANFDNRFNRVVFWLSDASGYHYASAELRVDQDTITGS
jgi:hypothetical protein